MRRLYSVLLVFFLVISWLPAQSVPVDSSNSQVVMGDPQLQVSRLNLRLRTIGNGEIALPATDLDLVFAELELVSNESIRNHDQLLKSQLENKKLKDKIYKQEKLKKAAPWICLITFGAGVVTGCVGGYLVQK